MVRKMTKTLYVSAMLLTMLMIKPGKGSSVGRWPVPHGVHKLLASYYNALSKCDVDLYSSFQAPEFVSFASEGNVVPKARVIAVVRRFCDFLPGTTYIVTQVDRVAKHVFFVNVEARNSDLLKKPVRFSQAVVVRYKPCRKYRKWSACLRIVKEVTSSSSFAFEDALTSTGTFNPDSS